MLSQRKKPAQIESLGPNEAGSRDFELVRNSVNEGGFFSLMVALGESYFPAFALACGLGSYVAGLVTTVPLLLGAFLQLFTPYFLPIAGSYKAWVLFFAACQGVMLFPLIYSSFHGEISATTFFICLILYSTGGMMAGPVWNSWISRIIPSSAHSTFFSHRTQRMQWVHLIGFLAGGIFLHLFQFENKGYVFGCFFIVAVVARFGSIFYLAKQPDLPDLSRTSPHARSPVIGFKHLKFNDPLRKFIVYILAVQFSANLAGPFVTPYFLSHLKFSYFEYAFLIVAGFAGKIIALPAAGRLVKKHGASLAFQWFGLGISIVPLLLSLSSNFWVLLTVQAFGGVVWAVFDLATQLHMVKTLPNRNRPLFLSYYHFGNAVVISLSSIIGGFIMTQLTASYGFYALFFISFSARILVQRLLLPVSTKTPILRLVRGGKGP